MIDEEMVRQFEPGTLELRQPNGQIADAVTYTEIADGTTWSRYPVHGGGWQANTPPTPGDFNLPASGTPTITPADPTTGASALALPQATDVSADAAPDEVALPRWVWLILSVLVGLVVWFMRVSRSAPPPLQ